MTILITGGAGFIGSNFAIDWLAHSDEPVINLDKLTYAGNLASLQGDARHHFVRGDIGDVELMARLLAEHTPRAVLNFAAESHVDRSIDGPEAFIQTNIVGTFHLLEAVRAYWGNLKQSSAPRSVSCTCPLMKCMVRWTRPKRPSARPVVTSPTSRIRPARRHPSIWCASTTIPTACRC